MLHRANWIGAGIPFLLPLALHQLTLRVLWLGDNEPRDVSVVVAAQNCSFFLPTSGWRDYRAEST